ncbi:J domain-containing protein [Oscillatoria sp. FACHB-1406]|nr:J domain-containing protein [Oscillatoria sp. FACHB-1406]MBD2580423.1 J domain-containing protein [Oscillatoria sp. FACHB-1406]
MVNNYYALLGVHPAASDTEIRRAYRELSKRYHPDTTELAPAIATAKFQQLNQAYATLIDPQKRFLYDNKIGYARFSANNAGVRSNDPVEAGYESNSAYLDPSDRPLSSGEIFALFILGLTLVGCALLVVVVAIARGELTF